MPKKTKEGPDFWPDNALDSLGATIIKSHHAHLIDAEVRFLLTNKDMTIGGRNVAGQARSPRGILHYFSNCDFLIVVADTFWRKADVRKRSALVDHELCHCSIGVKDGLRILSTVGHDVEEFIHVVQTYGLWRDSLIDFGTAAAEQLKLNFDKGA